MRLVLSGEGKKDMGQLDPTTEGLTFRPGPMAWMVDKLMESELGFSLLDAHATGADCVRLITKAELKQKSPKKPTLLAGTKSGKGASHFRRNAQVLGILAMEEAEVTSDTVIAVLFRDTDGTRSAPRDLWEAKWESIQKGFKLSHFTLGVAMLPRPKSEAWLLCGLKETTYQNCDVLEETPGNDASPNSLKIQLDRLLGHEASAEEQADWVASGRIDVGRIVMPSFQRFRENLELACRKALKPKADVAPSL